LGELLDVVAAAGASAVFWNRRYEPWAIEQDRRVKAELRARGVEARSFNGSLCHEPWEVTPAPDPPLTRFSFFAGLWLERGPPTRPLPVPALPPAMASAASVPLDELGLLPRGPDWAEGLREAWRPGEAGAGAALRAFLAGPVREYREARHLPGRDRATSRLSPHLRFGEISPRQVWHAAEAAGAPVARDRMPAFQRELVWREFAHHLLYFFPDSPERPLRAGFPGLPWGDDEPAFRAWCQGRTGYPLVDAGMRELWRTGYVHNRVRMVAASFLTKDLLVPWQRGAAWFWDTLCDADLANNMLGWQWVAGCGTDDAARRPPRILNPVAHGRRFDPDGAYVRRWVPELARLPDAFLHRPFVAPRAALAYAGVRLGETYPLPLVDHDAARERALAALGDRRDG
jgi:deoxyribodipyrimidine photo-lyase